MILRNGDCTAAIPIKRMQNERLRADALDIERTFATLYTGQIVVDEKITMPANYRFDKAIGAVVGEVFDLDAPKAVAENGKMALFEGERDGRPFRVLAIFRGKYDLQLLYPIPDGLDKRIVACLIEGKKEKEPVVVNRLEGDDARPPLSHWDEKLFTLGYIVNKDM